MRQCDGHFAIAWGKCDETKSLKLGPDEISSSHRITAVQRVTPAVPCRGPPASGALFSIFAGVVGRAHSIARPLTHMGAHSMPSK